MTGSFRHSVNVKRRGLIEAISYDIKRRLFRTEKVWGNRFCYSYFLLTETLKNLNNFFVLTLSASLEGIF